MKREIKDLTFGTDVQQRILNGARAVCEAVQSTYGIMSGNVLIEKNWGAPILTHDGVTVAKEVILEDPVENMGAQLIIQAATKTNLIAGDGTSATSILAYHIINKAQAKIAAGYNPMLLRKGIMSAAEKIKKFIEDNKTNISDKKLKEVAAISAGDDALGELIADTLLQVKNGGVTVEEYSNIGVESDIVDGFHFERGWNSPFMITNQTNEKAEYSNCRVLVTNKRLFTTTDVMPILDIVNRSDNKKLLVIGEVSGTALDTSVLNKLKGAIDFVSVGVPVFGNQQPLFLEDIAILTGGRVIQEGEPTDKLILEDFGLADRVVVSENDTTIIGGHGSKSDVKARIAQIEKQQHADDNIWTRERLGKRLAKLTGKVGVIRVGGATEIEQKETKFRVEDAVNATQAAREEGIVAGGATTLIAASAMLDTEDLGEAIVWEAVREPFKQLMHNAGHNSELLLGKIESAKIGEGYDLKNMSDTPVDLVKRGVIDPAKVTKQVIENSCSVASNAITTNCAITFIPQPEVKNDVPAA